MNFQEAINSAKSLQEMEYLQSVLASGRVPEEGWNKQLDLIKEAAANADGYLSFLVYYYEGIFSFIPEQDEEMES